MATKHLGALDELRGVASLVVVLTHAHIIFGSQWFRHGYLAVDFFMMLSGLVLSHAYEEKLLKGMSFADFIKIRLIRLYPCIAIGVLMDIASVLATSSASHFDIVLASMAGLLLLPAPHLNEVGFGLWPINPPSWSLFWEIIASAMLVLFVKTSNGILCALGLSLFMVLLYVGFQYGMLEVGFLTEHFYGGGARTLFAFILGIFIYRLYFLRSRRPVITRSNLVVMVILFLVFAVHAKWKNGYYDIAAVSIFFPLILVHSLKSTSTNFTFKYLGEISYPLYISHWPILVFARYIKEHYYAGNNILLGGVTIIVCLCLAILLYEFYDKPVRRYLNREYS